MKMDVREWTLEFGSSYFDDCGICDDDTSNDNLTCLGGCTNDGACNYNPNAVYDDSSCIYYDCAGECGGVAFIDDCGVCSEGTSNNIENSDDLGCGCFNEGPINFYYDQDEDGLGYGEPQIYCEDIAIDETENSIYELPPENWVANNLDPCPLDIENDSDQDGLCVYEDEDICPNDPYNDIDTDGICGDIDPCPLDIENDSDQDGLCENIDTCPLDPNNDIDGDGVCSNDEIIGCQDILACNFNFLATDFGECYYVDGVCETCVNGEIIDNDFDDDEICNIQDSCPLDPDNDIDSDGVCGDIDVCPGFNDNLDFDNDGIPFIVMNVSMTQLMILMEMVHVQMLIYVHMM